MNRSILFIIVMTFSVCFSVDSKAQTGNNYSRDICDKFYQAIRKNDSIIVLDYIKTYPHVKECIQTSGISHLKIALKNNNSSVLKILIEKKIGINNDYIKEIIWDYINIENEKIDELNLLLSLVSKKDKIDIIDWKTEYPSTSSGRLRYYDYISYRLIVLYHLDFIDIIADWESRLDFFITSVANNDFEILDLLDFTDEALNMDSCYGETVLTTAVRGNNLEMVKYLLSRGVDKDKREFAACYDDSVEEQNAYEIAKELGYNDILEILK